jgi:RNA recognition motif-containing protein
VAWPRRQPGTRGKGERISSKVFVGNLSFDVTADELQELFAKEREGVQVSLPTDRVTGRPRGFAFVEFATPEDAAAVIQAFDGFELAGRRLRVNEATEDRRAGGGGYGGDRPFASPPRPGKRSRPKGSRRNARARKRSIW